MALEIVSLSHRFRRQTVLHDVSLTVQTGDCYGLLGHNGAGKTTLLRTALGLLKPTAGTLALDGFDIRAYPNEARARLGGLVETPCFQETWNAWHNLEALARLQGFDRAGARAEAERVLAQVGLDKHEGVTPKKRVRDYSQGMRQRLGIAQALIGQPAYLVLDEPMNGLDPQALVEVRTLIKRLTQEQGVTVMVSSHQLAEIAGLCNRVAILRRGHLLVEDEIEHLLEADKRLYRLTVTGAPESVEATLHDMKLAPQLEQVRGQESRFVIDLGSRTAAQWLPDLVDKQIDLVGLCPCEPTLEEVYLRLERRPGQAPMQSRQASLTLTAPPSRQAPARPWWRGLRYEWQRIFSGIRMPLLLLAPAVAAGLAITKLHHQAMADVQKVGAEVFSVTPMTAFDGVGKGLQVGLPLLMVLLAGLASQSIAGEQSRGTLRYLLLRPLRRVQWGVSKFMALALMALLGYGLLVGTSLAVSATCFDFSDLAEALPNGKLFPLVSKSEMMAELGPVLWKPILPLLAYLSLGFALGSWIKNNVAALTATLGALIVIDLGRGFFVRDQVVGWLLSSHLPSALGGHCFLQYYCDVVQGVSNAVDPYAAWTLVVPLTWLVVTLVSALVALIRKAG